MNQSFWSVSRIFSDKKAYKSIKKLPISLWWSITEGASFEALVIDGKFSNLELYNIYLDLMQQYYDEFGTTETHESFIDARMNYALKLARYISTQNAFDKMLLEMALIDLKEATPTQDQNGKKQTLSGAITIIEESFGFQLDEETLSTYKFYSYQKRLSEKVEAQQQTLSQWRKR